MVYTLSRDAIHIWRNPENILCTHYFSAQNAVVALQNVRTFSVAHAKTHTADRVYIFADGSKDDDDVACAAVFLENVIDRRLPLSS